MLSSWKGCRSENTASGMASSMETIQISAALRQIFSRAWEAWISIGRTMALYLGQERGKLLNIKLPGSGLGQGQGGP